LLEEGKERLLAVLPLFHIYALTVDMLFGIRLGAEIVLHTRFDVEAVVKDLAAKKSRYFPGCRRCTPPSFIIRRSKTSICVRSNSVIPAAPFTCRGVAAVPEYYRLHFAGRLGHD
jgi:acyl-CoA synthetase (AMP-forming)/AMP-acid ligase II